MITSLHPALQPVFRLAVLANSTVGTTLVVLFTALSDKRLLRNLEHKQATIDSVDIIP